MPMQTQQSTNVADGAFPENITLPIWNDAKAVEIWAAFPGADGSSQATITFFASLDGVNPGENGQIGSSGGQIYPDATLLDTFSPATGQAIGKFLIAQITDLSGTTPTSVQFTILHHL